MKNTLRKSKLAVATAAGSMLALAGVAKADPVFDPTAAITAANTNMGSVVTACLALLGVGAAVRYGIKIWKAMRAAV